MMFDDKTHRWLILKSNDSCRVSFEKTGEDTVEVMFVAGDISIMPPKVFSLEEAQQEWDNYLKDRYVVEV